MIKICKNCNTEKSDFRPKKHRLDGFSANCRDCDKQLGTAYKRTKIGIIGRMYGNQKVNSKRRCHPAPSYSLTEFRNFLLDSDLFHKQYKVWVESEYDRLEAPSVDREDDNLPYSFNNIQVMSWRENKAKGHKAVSDGTVKNSTLLNGGHRPVEKWTRDGTTIIDTYPSQSEAVRQNPSIHQANIQKVCAGKIKSTGGFHWKYVGATTTMK
jgi:hypothetical protein